MSEMSIRERYYDALYNKSDNEKRLATSEAEEDYFKKQQATQEAIKHIENNQPVPEDIAKIVDVNALKRNMETSEGKDVTNQIASEIGGTSSKKSDTLNVKNESKEQLIQDMDDFEACCKRIKQELLLKDFDISKLTKADKEQAQIDKLLSKSLVDSNGAIEASSNSLFNPLEKILDDISQELSDNVVSFLDEFSGKNISLTITQEVSVKLTAKFGDLDSAADYVKGWYYDAAYRVGYLGADGDGDGNISSGEAMDLKALIGLSNDDNKPTYMSLNQAITDKSEREEFLNTFGFTDNITDFINNSIMQDSDMDGALNMQEIVGNQDTATELAKAVVSNAELSIFEFNSIAYGFQNEAFAFVSRFTNMNDFAIDNMLNSETLEDKNSQETTLGKEDIIEL